MAGQPLSHEPPPFGFCECCEEKRAVFDGLCRDCAHPDDVEFWEYDPGEEF